MPSVRSSILAAATIAATTVALGVSSAGASVVPNQFVRSCYIGCSPFVQSNGAYRSDLPSVCYTRSWGGTSSYTLPRGRRC